MFGAPYPATDLSARYIILPKTKYRPLNWKSLVSMIVNFAVSHLANLEPKIMFKLDGAAPHWRHFVRDSLDDIFPSRWIGCGGLAHFLVTEVAKHYSMLCFCFKFVVNRVYANKVNSVEWKKLRSVKHLINFLCRCWLEFELI